MQTFQEYLADPAISQSDLKAFDENPQLYYTRKRGLYPPWLPSTELKKKLDFGKLVERFLLHRGDDDGIIVIPGEVLGKGEKRNTNAWRAWRDEQPTDAILLTSSEYKEKMHALQQIETNLREHKEAAKLLHGGRAHHRGKWVCPFTGLQRKCEIDWVFPENETLIVDIKTAADVRPDAFAMQAEKLGYAKQQATYEQCAADEWGASGFGEGVDRFLFLAIRNTAPYNVEVHELSREWIDDAGEWNEKTMERLAKAIEDDNWQSRTHGSINVLNRPRVGKYRFEQEMDIIGESNG